MYTIETHTYIWYMCILFCIRLERIFVSPNPMEAQDRAILVFIVARLTEQKMSMDHFQIASGVWGI